MSTTDTRIKSIKHWLKHTLNLEIQSFEPASSDASFRRYFRVIHNDGHHVIMDAPPDKENTEPFIQVAALFKEKAVNVPEIYHQELDQGFLLLEDFGSDCLLDQLNHENALTLYQSAFQSLFKLQTRHCDSDYPLNHYDESLITRELNIFYEWFLDHFLDIVISDELKNSLNRFLISSALAQPTVCVHRDFHSRNLMLTAENSPGVIDFQDAVIGPVTYDLVSLLRDCYIAWPEEQVELWMAIYYQKIKNAGLIDVNLQTFRRWFDLMGLQRHLKAIGIFSRLHLRDNKSDYLADIPRTMTYVCQICNKYPELDSFNQLLTNTILPAYKNRQ